MRLCRLALLIAAAGTIALGAACSDKGDAEHAAALAPGDTFYAEVAALVEGG